MKKKILVLVALALLVLPFATFAKENKFLEDYETLNLEETLKEEKIEQKYKDYKETDKQVTIYLFRGNGCSYCDAFLKFLNDNAEKYGKYYKLVSFEVWGNAKNADLLEETAEFLGQSVGGVPFIIIGDQVFPGYASDYDDGIIATLKKEYEKEEKYDVFEELQKARKEQERKERLPIVLSIACIVTSVLVPLVCMIIILLQIKKSTVTTNAKLTHLESIIKENSKTEKTEKVEKEFSSKKENKSHKKPNEKNNK